MYMKHDVAAAEDANVAAAAMILILYVWSDRSTFDIRCGEAAWGVGLNHHPSPSTILLKFDLLAR